MLLRVLALLFFLAPAALLPGQAASQVHTRASLLAEAASIQPGKSFEVGVLLVMEPGWHTYWKNPGDSGLPTTIQWTLPPGFSAGEIQWPTPQPINASTLVSYGYEGQVLLMTRIQAPEDLKPGAKVKLSASVSWLECHDICQPVTAAATLVLPVKTSLPEAVSSETTTLFAQTRRQLPLRVSQLQLPITQIQVNGNAARLSIKVTGKTPWPETTKVYFFPGEAEAVDSAAAQKLVLRPEEKSFVLTLARPPSAPALSELKGVLTIQEPGVERGMAAIEISVPVQPIEPRSGGEGNESAPPLTLLVALVFAFFGGVILNLMPCVLPVLSLKVLGLVRHADDRSAWKQGVAFSLGVVASFWVLVAVLLVLRSTGEQLGWGFQMQSPLFIAALAGVFLIFALNLFGVFEIGTSLVGVDAAAARRGGWLGSFGMGALATVAATPCTAPFMGASLGFAATQSPETAFLVFTFLALGMASPYLLLSCFPGLQRFVPKPGAWMESFKQFLGFLLLGTVIFLLWVFSQQLGSDALILLLSDLLVVGIAAWIYGRWARPERSLPTRTAGRTLALVCFVAAGIWAWRIASMPPEDQSSRVQDGALQWEAYSPQRLEQLRAEGKAVFLDFTAAWCLSCKVNEAVALNNAEVRAKFLTSGVVLMKADWTRRDPVITQALASFGRSGVPLYVLYGRNQTEPKLLPEVLTPGVVVSALESLK